MRGSTWSGVGVVVVLGGSTVLAGSGADEITVGEGTWTRYEWRASTFDRSAQSQASIAGDDDGNLVAVWSSRRQQGGRYGVYAQRFDAAGVAVGEETPLNLWTSSHQWMPSVAIGRTITTASADSEGSTPTPVTVPWIAWQSHGQDGQAGSIVARRMAAPGAPAWSGSDEIMVNEEWRGHQSDPVVVAAPDGGALIVWTSTPAVAEVAQVRGRRLAASGAPIGPEFGVCDGDDWHQRLPGAAFGPDGGFAIVYAVGTDDPGVSGIRLQRFDANADAVGPSILVSGASRPSQIEPVIATLADGYVVAWLDSASDGHDYGVIAQRLDAGGAPRGPAFVVNTTTTGPQTAPALAVARDGRFAIAWNGPDRDGQGIFGQIFAADARRLGPEFRINRHTAGDQAMRTAAATSRLAFTPAGALACVWAGDAGLGDDSSVNVTMLSRRPLDLGGRSQGVTESMRPAGVADADTAATPHEPPTFDPKLVDDAEREIRLAPGGGIGFTAVVNTGWTPPDPHLAVGPEHVVVMTNGEISVFEKNGTRIFQDEIEGSFGFWGDQGASGFIFDPEVLYDPMSERFFAMAADRDSSNGHSYALVAVSFDSTPDDTGDDWHKYRFDTTTLSGPTFDSPNIGVDDEVVYVTGDGFGGPQPYPCYTFDKASLLNGDPPAIRRDFFLSTGTQSAGLPPVTFDDPPALYLIEHRESASNTAVRLIALQDPLGSPNFVTTTLTVPAYGRPEDPPQAGTSSRPNTFDARFWSVAYRDGSLWATHHINSDRVLARWYEIAMNGWPDSGELPELVQSGNIDPGAGIRTFFSSITVDEFGNAAMCYARSSPSEFISMETSYRYKTDPLGTFQPGEIRATATAGYTAGRWGDYSAVNVDPTDGKTFWAHHEYAIGSSWRTWVEGFTPPFAAADVNCDGAVNFEDILRVLGAWGPCDGCPEDVNEDGVVDFADILVILTQWS